MTDIVYSLRFLGSSDFLPAGDLKVVTQHTVREGPVGTLNSSLWLYRMCRGNFLFMLAKGLGHGKIIPPLNLACLY